MFGGFVPEQIAWSREGTGLQSEIKLPETLEGPLRRFTEFERGEVKFSLIPQPTFARATFKKQQTLLTLSAWFRLCYSLRYPSTLIKGRNDFVPTIMANGNMGFSEVFSIH